MKKKLIITESQYAKLKKRLVETPFDELTKKDIKVGDIIKIERDNKIYSYKVISSFGGQIQMDGLDAVNEKFRFYISSNALEKNKFHGKQILKTQDLNIMKNPNSWNEFNNTISKFEVIKKNETISFDVNNGQITKTSTNNQPETPDTNNQPETPGTEPEADEVKPVLPDGHTEEELKKAGEEILSHYDSKTGKTNDPILQNLLIRNPKFFERVEAEMKNVRVSHSGIIAALQLASDYVDKKLGKGFIPYKKVKYQVLDMVFIDYITKDNAQAQFSRELNKEYYATNERQVVGHNYKTLINKEENYQIKVVEKVEGENDVFNCKFYKIADLKLNVEPNLYSNPVKIRFLESEGYIPETK